jgi:hypothetical protein
MLDGYLRRIRSGEEITFDYEGEWEELMAEARPEIAAAVEELKNR